ncbi:MAG: esterase-like activity of phytase family protein [Pseudomonadota bacterium]
MALVLAGLGLIAAVAAESTVMATALPLPGPEATGLGCLTMTSSHSLSGGRGFGGFSGMVLDAGTGDLLLLADNGRIQELNVTLNKSGEVTGINGGASLSILDQNGRRLAKRNGDTEAIAPWEDGYLVTRERVHDALLIEPQDGNFIMRETIVDLSGGQALSNNGGYEAATALDDGQALFISEGTLRSGEAMMMLFDGENLLDRGLYRPADGFAVTDIIADETSDRLFGVERAFSASLGPRTRLTVAPLDSAIDDNAVTLVPAELGQLTLAEGTDNMEGLAFYRSSDGGENLMIVSDDNFNPIQRTVLMTFRLGDTCPLQ